MRKGLDDSLNPQGKLLDKTLSSFFLTHFVPVLIHPPPQVWPGDDHAGRRCKATQKDHIKRSVATTRWQVHYVLFEEMICKSMNEGQFSPSKIELLTPRSRVCVIKFCKTFTLQHIVSRVDCLTVSKCNSGSISVVLTFVWFGRKCMDWARLREKICRQRECQHVQKRKKETFELNQIVPGQLCRVCWLMKALHIPLLAKVAMICFEITTSEAAGERSPKQLSAAVSLCHWFLWTTKLQCLI